MRNALGRRAGAGAADERCDEASARWFDFANATAVPGTNALTEQTPTTKAISTRAKFVMSPSPPLYLS